MEKLCSCVLMHVYFRFQRPVDNKHNPAESLNYLCLEFKLNTHAHTHTNRRLRENESLNSKLASFPKKMEES